MKLEDEIENLSQMVIKMADMVENNLSTAFSLLESCDEEKLSLINDDIVDLHERLVEEMSMSILLRERPYASDMRKVLGILKLVEDIERLGDHAEDIRNFAVKLKECEQYEFPKVSEAINYTIQMVHNSMNSFITRNLELAKKTIKDDDIIDKLYDEIIEDIARKDQSNEISSKYAVYMTLIVKYIERIADHSVNVAEWVIYILLGYHKDKQIF